MKYFLIIFLGLFLIVTNKFSIKNPNIEEIKCSPNCLICESGKCTKCARGLYSFKNSCFESCPFENYADNYTFLCLEKDKKPLFTKAYTLSRCMNSCGKIFHDCSCHSSCEKSGDCCSDYQLCDIIEKNHSVDCLINNCKFCTLDRKTCLQCKDNFFYNENKCLISCPANTVSNSQNICQESKNLNGKCSQGNYNFEGKCLKSCPLGFRANRIDFTCKNEKEFAFYWVFPSRESCLNKCGDNTKSDCSCKFSCLRRGNCCDNFEKECGEEMRKEKCSKLCENCNKGKCELCKNNSEKKINGACMCMKDYKYDVEEDICVIDKILEIENLRNGNEISFLKKNQDNSKNNKLKKAYKKIKSQKIIFLAKDNLKSTNSNEKTEDLENGSKKSQRPVNLGLNIETKDNPLFFTNNNSNIIDSQQNNNEIKDYDKISSSLTSHLKSTFFKLFDLLKSEPKKEVKDDAMSVYLNGNISLNLMDNNLGTNLTNKNEYILNSNNLNNQKTNNNNSFNKLKKIKTQGNVTKIINKGEIDNMMNTKKNINFRKIDINKDIHIDHEKMFSENLGYLNQKTINFTNNIVNSDIKNTTVSPLKNYNLAIVNIEHINKTIAKNNIKNGTKIKITINDHKSNNSKKINKSEPIHNNSSNLSINNYSNNVHVLNLEKDKNKTNFFKPTNDNSSLSANINVPLNTRSLIIGQGNVIKDNHLIHNIINVHNTYLIPSKNISNLYNHHLINTTQNKKVQNTIDPKLVIIVNANKIGGRDNLN